MRGPTPWLLAATLAPVARPCDPPPAGQVELVRTGRTAGDDYGAGVGISGTTAAIGSPHANDAAPDSGAVVIFRQVAGAWTEQEHVTMAGRSRGFGAAVAIEGATLVVGAPEAAADGSGGGSAHAFDHDGSAWIEHALLPSSEAGARIGSAVALDGDRLVVGADSLDAGVTDAGGAWSYVRSGGTWLLEAPVLAADRMPGDGFGASVALDGDTLIVGAPARAGATRGGAAMVFTWTGATWEQQARLTAPDGGARRDDFGAAVAIVGDTALVGAPRRLQPDGVVDVFERRAGVWTWQARLTAPDDPLQSSQRFGQSIAVDGRVAVIGEPRGGAERSGLAHVFVARDATWRRVATMAGPGPADWDWYPELGTAVAISGDNVIAGAPLAGSNTVRIGRAIAQPLCLEADCADGQDDDRDGAADCADLDCQAPPCPEICGDGQDNDGDGGADCGDDECFAVSCAEDCADGGDNDLDGAADCADTDCNVSTCREACDDARDNDADGLIDCADPGCFSTACVELCSDRADNDRDGLYDCADPGCAGQSGASGQACEPDGEASCADGGDNDGDRLIDCADSDCAGLTGPLGLACESPQEATCDDGLDGDADGSADCDDRDCAGLASCPCPGAPPDGWAGCAPVSFDACRGWPPPEWSHAWDWFPDFDADGDGNPCDDYVAGTCVGTPPWRNEPGPHAWCYSFTSATGSSSGRSDGLVLPAQPSPRPAATNVTCEGDVALLTCGLRDACAAMRWDLDAAADSDGNGVADDDADAPGCDASVVARAGSLTVVAISRPLDPALDSCETSASLVIRAEGRVALAPTVVAGCADVSMTRLDCGSSAAALFAWDLDVAVDADGNGDASDDAEALGCAVLARLPRGRTVVRCTATRLGCASHADLAVDVSGPDEPRPRAITRCASDPVQLSCGIDATGLAVSWDLDVAADSDGDGEPANDGDASGCDVSAIFVTDGTYVKVTVSDGACSRSSSLQVFRGAAWVPFVVDDDRVALRGGGLAFTRGDTRAASRFRIARGDLGALWATGRLDFAADDAAGRGTCDTGPVFAWTDPDDATDEGSYYWIVTAVNDCNGREGSAGSGWNGAPVARPSRTPTPACP